MSGAHDLDPAAYVTESSDLRYRGLHADVRVDTVRMPDGDSAEREVVEQRDAVAVVALTPTDEVVLVRQYRHPFRDVQVEIPAGKLDDGEQPEPAMQRELVEEVQLEAGSLQLLTIIRNSAGWTDEVTHLYLGTDLRERTPPEEFVAEAEEAAMQVLRLPLADAVAQVLDGSITDAKTVIGLLFVAALRSPAEGRK